MMHAKAMTRSSHAAAPLELHGRALVVARLLWLVLVLQAVVLFALSIPARYNQLSHPPADVRAQVIHAGLSIGFYAVYLTTIGCVFGLVCCAVAALIVRHRANDRIGLLASLYLVLNSLTNSPQMHVVAVAYPGLALPANVSLLLCVMFLVGFFFVFPDGRFVPRWARVPGLLYAVAAVFAFIITGASIAQDPPGWLAMMILAGSALGIAAQVYRYVRVSDSLQRHQTKWVAFGASVAIAVTLIFAFAGPALPTIGGSDPDPSYDMTSTTAITLAGLSLPVSLGVAILRYRLWDIDVVLNRALVYGSLSAVLIALYLAVSDGIGALVQAQGHLPVALLGTALIAVLFAPLRGRLQTGVNRLMYGERDDPYRVLTRVGERVGAAEVPDAVLQAIVETVAHALKARYVAVQLTGGDDFLPAASHGSLFGVPTHLPLEYQGEKVGELVVGQRAPGEQFSAADRRLLEDLARQIGPAAHAVRLTSDLQQSRERLVTAREEERRRLRRDLHDGLGPQLAAVTLKIETMRNRFAGNAELDASLVELTDRIGAALSDIRRLVYGLRPPALDELGLISALTQLAAQYDQQGEGHLRVIADLPDALPHLPAAVEVAVYRIAQEALANVARHSGARACRLALTHVEGGRTLRLEIADDGVGLPDQHPVGVGLVSMRERAEELGGRLTITSASTGRTTVLVELPYSPKSSALPESSERSG